MSAVTRSLAWFYHAFGLDHVRAAGKNAWLIIVARALRMFAYGTNSLILALFFSEIGFSDARIGTFMTLTLLGDVIIGTALTLVADRVGRRNILLFGSALMVLTGCMFATFESFWILLLAAIIGVISATGGDYGPFRSIEVSTLSQLTTTKSRGDVLAWYVTSAAIGSTLGSEASGRIIESLTSREGWTLADAYHAIFWIYAVMGVVNAVLVLLLNSDCEADLGNDKYTVVAQDDGDDDDVASSSPTIDPSGSTPATSAASSRRSSLAPPNDSWTSWLSSWVGEISRPTLSVMWKLWALLAIDSLSDGMVPYSLTNYYLDDKFHPSKATLGDLTSMSYFLSCIGGLFAGPLARKIGLINTMVFTHIPSSAAVLLFPFPNSLWLTATFFFIRAGLNNMDQAPRSALIAGVVRPNERTAVMGITSTVRTLAATAGPLVTGLLAGSHRFWIAFVAGGACRLTYDLGLWVIFINVKLRDDDTEPAEVRRRSTSSDEEGAEDSPSAEPGFVKAPNADTDH